MYRVVKEWKGSPDGYTVIHYTPSEKLIEIPPSLVAAALENGWIENPAIEHEPIGTAEKPAIEHEPNGTAEKPAQKHRAKKSKVIAKEQASRPAVQTSAPDADNPDPAANE